MIVVCTGETSESIRHDSLVSVRDALVATMESSWWFTAQSMKLPRMFFNDKLKMMRFVLRNDNKAVLLQANDKTAETAEMVASFYAMGVGIWKVVSMEEVAGV